MSATNTNNESVSEKARWRRVGVLVVHGVGEQTRFEHLEEIGLNLAKAAKATSADGPLVDMRYGGQTVRHAGQLSWHDAPVILRWQREVNGEKQPWIEAHLQEVYWADFGMSPTVRDWLRMLWWIISMPGARVFSAGDGLGQESADLPLHGLAAPGKPTSVGRLLERMYLWLVCSIATPLVALAKPIEILVTRLLSWNLPLPRVLSHTLGNVMLYQDAKLFVDRLESFSEKRRVGIRRRMVQGLLNMAAKVEKDKLDGFYIISHSLGTVIAFNALMESPAAFPNFLSQEEWTSLPASLKASGPQAPPDQIPSRPPWLQPGNCINRQALFSKCKGFLTAGSPLDKFAALWPAIIPINTVRLDPEIRWVNVADGLDIVANQLQYFPLRPDHCGGFFLENHGWGGAPTPITAHTSYWTVKGNGRPRLMNWIVHWLEDENFPGPELQKPPPGHKLHLLIWLIVLGLIAFLVTGFVVAKILDIFRSEFWNKLPGMNVLELTALAIISSFGVVLASSLGRRLYERHRWGPQK